MFNVVNVNLFLGEKRRGEESTFQMISALLGLNAYVAEPAFRVFLHALIEASSLTRVSSVRFSMYRCECHEIQRRNIKYKKNKENEVDHTLIGNLECCLSQQHCLPLCKGVDALGKMLFNVLLCLFA